MSGHTPGTWQACGYYIRGPYSMGDESKPGLLIATVAGAGDEAAANATLLAAAPDLLEALKDAVEYLKHHLPDEVLEPHLAAIAKASGEHP